MGVDHKSWVRVEDGKLSVRVRDITHFPSKKMKTKQSLSLILKDFNKTIYQQLEKICKFKTEMER